MSKGNSGLFIGTKGSNGASNSDSNINSDTNAVKLSKERLNHSSKGDFQQNGRMTGGGHGQENIEKLEIDNINYEIIETFSNGVRRGNVSNHVKKSKKEEGRQLWFPRSWTRSDIRKAGEAIAKTVDFDKMAEGEAATGIYKRVRIRIIKRNGIIGTVCPDSDQSNIKGEQ